MESLLSGLIYYFHEMAKMRSISGYPTLRMLCIRSIGVLNITMLRV